MCCIAIPCLPWLEECNVGVIIILLLATSRLLVLCSYNNHPDWWYGCFLLLHGQLGVLWCPPSGWQFLENLFLHLKWVYYYSPVKKQQWLPRWKELSIDKTIMTYQIVMYCHQGGNITDVAGDVVVQAACGYWKSFLYFINKCSILCLSFLNWQSCSHVGQQ